MSFSSPPVCVSICSTLSLNSYAKHNECITEDQKYGGQNYQQKEFKGKSKQNNWINGVKSLCDKNNYPKNVQNILRSLTSYENVPRKKAKFLNFVKNSFRLRDDVLANEVWNLIESELKNNNNGTSQTNGNNDTKNGNENSNGIVRKLEDAESDKSEEANNNKKLKTEETPDQNTEKIKMKKVIKEVLSNYEEIELTKLRKKVSIFLINGQ